MRILVRGQWLEGYLDEWRSESDYRIRVNRFVNLERLDDVYFVRQRSPQMLLNYLRELGPVDVVRKVLSRSKERRRNDRFVSVGCGTVIEAPREGKYRLDQHVVFVAPCHPACVERVVLPESLLGEATEREHLVPPDHIRYLPFDTLSPADDRWWSDVRGWSSSAGIDLAASLTNVLHSAARRTVEAVNWTSANDCPHWLRRRSGNAPRGHLRGGRRVSDVRSCLGWGITRR